MSHVIEAQFLGYRKEQAQPAPYWVPSSKQREAFLDTLIANAKMPRYAPTIMVREKKEGRRVMYLALNPKAELLAEHETGDPKMPFSEKLLLLAASLGFQVEVIRS